MNFNTDPNPYTCNKECLHGKCILDINEFPSCSCDEGYGGESCDEMLEICPDGKTICLNGSTCGMNNKGYYCDCNSSGSIYAGEQCEYPATSFCEYGVSTSTMAFCTNTGICKEILVDKNKKFKGCNCPDDYTGTHCEYLISGIELKQPWYYKITQTTKSIKNKNEATFRGFVISAIVLIALVFLFAVKKMVQRGLKRRKAGRQHIQTADEKDLHLEPDGDLMPKEDEVIDKVKDSNDTSDAKDIEDQKDESIAEVVEEKEEKFVIDESDDDNPKETTDPSTSFEENKIV